MEEDYVLLRSRDPKTRCYTCDVELHTVHNLKIHLEGKKHKRMELYLKSEGKNTYCSICEVDLKTYENFDQHIRGKKHIKSSRLLKEDVRQSLRVLFIFPASDYVHTVCIINPLDLSLYSRSIHKDDLKEFVLNTELFQFQINSYFANQKYIIHQGIKGPKIDIVADLELWLQEVEDRFPDSKFNISLTYTPIKGNVFLILTVEKGYCVIADFYGNCNKFSLLNLPTHMNEDGSVNTILCPFEFGLNIDAINVSSIELMNLYKMIQFSLSYNSLLMASSNDITMKIPTPSIHRSYAVKLLMLGAQLAGSDLSPSDAELHLDFDAYGNVIGLDHIAPKAFKIRGGPAIRNIFDRVYTSKSKLISVEEGIEILKSIHTNYSGDYYALLEVLISETFGLTIDKDNILTFYP